MVDLCRGPDRWSLLLVLVGALGLASSAAAVERAKVVLVGAADDPTLIRVRDELRLLGLRVDVLETSEREKPAALARARRAEAVAVIEEWPPEVVLWIEPPEGSSAAAATTLNVADSLGADARPELLALRAVEVLRGRLLPLPASPPPEPAATSAPQVQGAPGRAPSAAPGGEPATVGEVGGSGTAGARPVPPADEPVDDVPPEVRARPWALGLSPTLALSPGGAPPMFRLRPWAGYRIGDRFGVEAHVAIPTAGGALGEPEGEVRLHLLSFGAGGTLALVDGWHDFTLATALGVGAAALFYGAEPAGDYESASGSRWAVMPYLGLSASYGVAPYLALRADGQASLLLPEQILRVAGREIASLGTPVVSFGLGLEVRL